MPVLKSKGVRSITFESVDAIITVLNAYEEATMVSDLIFQIARLGKTTFEELASSLGTAEQERMT